MALPNRSQFNTQRDNFTNAIRGSRGDSRMLQAAPSAQQALPVQQNTVNQFYQQRNAFIKKLNDDSFLQRTNQQQQQLGFAVKQKQQSYINSLQQFFNTAPPELRQFLSSPQVMQNLIMSYQKQQPEVQQLQNLSQQQNQYVQTNYGEEQRRLANLQMQFNQQQQNARESALRSVKNYNYLPEGLTQEEFNKQVRINMTQEFKTPEQMAAIMKAFYDSYRQEKGMKSPEEITLQEKIAEISNPKFEDRIVRRELVKPDQPIRINNDPIVDPLRPTTTSAPTQIKAPPPNMIVDPKREAFTLPKTINPASPVGLMNKTNKKRKTGTAPSQYSGVNTNVRGLMKQ